MADGRLMEWEIKQMVDRFLGWKLPENFNPDGGINFKKMRNENTSWPAKNEPTGTNLFDAQQAEEMVRYMVAALAERTVDGPKMYPRIVVENGSSIQFGVCSECSVVRAFTRESNHAFPDTGWWINCPVCGGYRMYYRLSHQLKLVSKEAESAPPEARRALS